MIETVRDYYNGYDEDARLASKRGRVEFLTTMRYIEKYIAPGARVCEIGAGTGRYSLALARMGYPVDAVELLEHNIDVFRQNMRLGEGVTVRQGDARDLSFLKDGTYDMTLLLGPLYHLFTEADKLRALSEALRVTKPGGILMVAYCIADATILESGFVKGQIGALIEGGLIDPVTFRAASRPEEVFELHRKEDVDGLMAGFPAERLDYVATDLYTKHMRATVEEMDDETFSLYLRYHFSICERPDMVGMTHHSLDIHRKR